MKLGKRLLTVAEMIGNSKNIADIGSDHALLPIWLLEQEKIQSAVAGELGDGPFLRAEQAARASGFQARLEVRQGDGLQILYPGEVETVVMAGMGGDLMVEILEHTINKTRSFSRYILQPMKHEAVLRKWLSEQGWPIIQEKLIYENGKYYIALETRPDTCARPLKDLEILLGPQLLHSKETDIITWLNIMQNKYEQIAQKVCASRTANEEEKKCWKERASQLKNILAQK